MRLTSTSSSKLCSLINSSQINSSPRKNVIMTISTTMMIMSLQMGTLKMMCSIWRMQEKICLQMEKECSIQKKRRIDWRQIITSLISTPYGILTLVSNAKWIKVLSNLSFQFKVWNESIMPTTQIESIIVWNHSLTDLALNTKKCLYNRCLASMINTWLVSTTINWRKCF